MVLEAQIGQRHKSVFGGLKASAEFADTLKKDSPRILKVESEQDSRIDTQVENEQVQSSELQEAVQEPTVNEIKGAPKATTETNESSLFEPAPQSKCAEVTQNESDASKPEGAADLLENVSTARNSPVKAPVLNTTDTMTNSMASSN